MRTYFHNPSVCYFVDENIKNVASNNLCPEHVVRYMLLVFLDSCCENFVQNYFVCNSIECCCMKFSSSLYKKISHSNYCLFFLKSKPKILLIITNIMGCHFRLMELHAKLFIRDASIAYTSCVSMS